MGSLLTSYDLALVQEDFVLRKALSENARHPDRSPHDTKILLFFSRIGDGLNRYSALELRSLTRTQ